MIDLQIRSGPDGVVHLAGEFDVTAQADFEAATAPSIEGPGDVVLDVGDLRFVDSTGVRLILRLAERVRPRRVVLRGANGVVARVFEILGIDDTRGISIEPPPTPPA